MKRGRFVLFVLGVAFLSLVLTISACSAKKGPTESSPTKNGSSSNSSPTKKTDWPTKPVNILIGFAAGGPTDVMLQTVRPGVEKKLGQALVPVNKPGSGGDIAWTELKGARPDGYTLGAINSPNILTNPKARQTAYTINDLRPIANVMTDPGVILVSAQSPIKSLEDLIKAAKTKPGALTVGVAGVPGDDWLGVQMLQQLAGIELKIVPFEGDGPSMQAVMGGHTDLNFNNMNLVLPQIKAGKVRALAVLAEKRFPLLPDVPTASELGYKVVMGSSRGFAGPKGLPQEIVDALAAAIKEAMETEEFKQMIRETGFPADYKGPAEYEKYLNDSSAAVSQLMDKYYKKGN